MNRRERRKLARILNDDPETRVPVMCGEACLELAGPERLRYLLKARNVRAVTRHRDHKVVELQVSEHGNDTMRKSTGGNASTYSHDNETETNPQGCWTLRRLRKAS